MRTGVVIWPDPQTYAEVDELRARYDAQHKLIGPHITVAFPAVVDAPAEALDTAMNRIAAHTPSFRVTIDRWAGAPELLASYPASTRYLIERYPNARNLVVLIPSEGQKEMLALRRAFNTVIPQPDLLMDYPLYMTLGQTLSDERLVLAQSELADYQPAYHFQVTSFDLLAEQANGTWVTVRSYHLHEANRTSR